MLTLPVVLAALLVAIAYAASTGAMARRILGTPVGWPRTFLVGLAVFAANSPVATSIATAAGLVNKAGRVVVAPAVGMLFIVLAFAWVFAFGVAALVVSEALWPTGSVPNPLQMVRGAIQRRRRARRYLHILAIASRHGMQVFLSDRGDRQRPAPPANDAAPPANDTAAIASDRNERTALGLVAALNEAGVTFVKLGQLLSTRRDLLPGPYVEALSRLQTRAQSEPWASIRAVIEQEVGGPLGNVFARVDEAPLAAASVAQVHAAQLIDGTEVVVKVQRPGARAQVEADIDIILRLARRIETRTLWGRELGALALAQGFAASLREELDYRIEYRNTELVRQSSISQAGTAITVPRVFGQASTRRLLTIERLQGRALGDAGPVLETLPAGQRADLAAGLFDAVLRQILVHGIFHADLHPGNLILLADHSLGMLDFGSIGILDRDARELLATLLLAASTEDNIAAADALLLLAEVPDTLNVSALRRDLGTVLTVMRYQAGGEAALFARLFDVIRRHRLAVPPHVAAAFRTIASLQGGLALIDPGFDLAGQARARAPQILRDLLTPSSIAGAMQSQTAVLLAIGKRLPQRLESISADLEQGKLGLRMRPFAAPDDRSWLAGLVNESLSALLAATAIIGAIILVVAPSGPLITPTVRLYAFVGYVLGFVGFVLALRALIRLFSRDRW